MTASAMSSSSVCPGVATKVSGGFASPTPPDAFRARAPAVRWLRRLPRQRRSQRRPGGWRPRPAPRCCHSADRARRARRCRRPSPGRASPRPCPAGRPMEGPDGAAARNPDARPTPATMGCSRATTAGQRWSDTPAGSRPAPIHFGVAQPVVLQQLAHRVRLVTHGELGEIAVARDLLLGDLEVLHVALDVGGTPPRQATVRVAGVRRRSRRRRP